MNLTLERSRAEHLSNAPVECRPGRGSAGVRFFFLAGGRDGTGQDEAARRCAGARGRIRRAGATETALRRRLRRLVRADDAQGDHPVLRGQARRQGRVRRRQLDRHARQAAGAEGQPADRRGDRRRRPDVPGDVSSASARRSRAWPRATSTTAPSSRTTRRSASAWSAPASCTTPRSSRRRAGRRRPPGTTSRTRSSRSCWSSRRSTTPTACTPSSSTRA